MRQFTELDSIVIEGVALEHEESIGKQTRIYLVANTIISIYLYYVQLQVTNCVMHKVIYNFF